MDQSDRASGEPRSRYDIVARELRQRIQNIAIADEQNMDATLKSQCEQLAQLLDRKIEIEDKIRVKIDRIDQLSQVRIEELRVVLEGRLNEFRTKAAFQPARWP